MLSNQDQHLYPTYLRSKNFNYLPKIAVQKSTTAPQNSRNLQNCVISLTQNCWKICASWPQNPPRFATQTLCEKFCETFCETFCASWPHNLLENCRPNLHKFHCQENHKLSVKLSVLRDLGVCPESLSKFIINLWLKSNCALKVWPFRDQNCSRNGQKI